MKGVFFFLVALFSVVNGLGQNNDQPIAPELVGKWCYINLNTTQDLITNSCITFNADGTFEAVLDRSTIPGGNNLPSIQDTDSGKWWVKENRVYYNSSGNGQGSFIFQKMNHPRLENTPMIVVNGIAFATAQPREPW